MYTHLFPWVQVTVMGQSLPLGYSYMSIIAEQKGLEVREMLPSCLRRKQISMLEKTAIYQEEQGSHADRYMELSSLVPLYRSLEYKVSYFNSSLTFPIQIFSLSGIYVCTESMRNDFPSLQGLGFSFQRHISVSSCFASLTLNKPKMWSLISAKMACVCNP